MSETVHTLPNQAHDTSLVKTHNPAAAKELARAARTKRVMLAIVSLSAERWPTSARLIDLCNAEAGQDPQTRIMFLTSLRKIISDMPVKVFLDLEQRDKVLAAAQDALDELIDEMESGEDTE